MTERPSLRTPLARVRHLGAARSGTQHFWHQRVTSVASIPLTIILLVVIVSLIGRNHAATVQVLGSPFVAITLLLFVITNVYHMYLGMQVIIEDYVHNEQWKLTLLMTNTFFSFVVGFACCYAILKMSFGV